MKEILLLNAMREGYAVNQVHETMTAGELIGFLEQFDEGTPIYLSHDDGYTYGGITETRFEEAELDDEGNPDMLT